MEWRAAGKSDIRFPVIGMGTWRTFDVTARADQAERQALVQEALDRSVRLFDSSPMYGESERVLGAALRGVRDRALVATKVWSHDIREGHAQIDRALHFFDGLVDLYQVHNLVKWRDYLPVFERMKADGSIRLSGVTHYQPGSFPEIARIMRSESIDAIQIPYNVMQRDAEQVLLPLASDLGLAVIVMQPLGEGRFVRQCPPSSAIRSFADHGCTTWAQVLLKWVLSDDRVTAVIPATRSRIHLRDNALAGQPPWFGPHERAEIVRLADRYLR